MTEESPGERLRMWAHELASMGRTGLEFSANPYDTDRFERTLRIAHGIAELAADGEVSIERPYFGDLGIVTPKVGCQFAAFDADGRIVLIRRADNGRWALPAGWAEVGTTPEENAVRELREETGFEGEIDGLVAVYDSRAHGGTNAYHFYTLVFHGRIVGGTLTPSHETPEVRLVDPTGALPEPMSSRARQAIGDAMRVRVVPA